MLISLLAIILANGLCVRGGGRYLSSYFKHHLPPQGVLMYGPPGTGKTLLARAVAHHTDCTFIRVSGAELVQKYIGEGSRMVREANRTALFRRYVY
jgi:SpoVK/Ycf46/Vps4 family AAA+-type ATPase